MEALPALAADERCFRVTPSRNSIAMKALPSCSDVIDRANIRMVQCGCSLGLTLKAGQDLGVQDRAETLGFRSQ